MQGHDEVSYTEGFDDSQNDGSTDGVTSRVIFVRFVAANVKVGDVPVLAAKREP